MPDAPRLFLITPPLRDAAAFAPLLETALAAADVACVLIRSGARDEHDLRTIVRVLAPLAQGHGAAALIEGEARLAARLDVDGVHVEGVGERLDEALATLRPQQRIVGVGALASRDDAMGGGESGVDYLMFGHPGAADPAAVRDRVAWWAAIFNVPCVGYAATPQEAGALAEAGAEFVALCDGLWERPDAVASTLRAVSHAMAATLEPAR